MVSALGLHDGESWLDPCVGQGAFLAAMTRFGVSCERITVVDLDRRQPELATSAERVCATDFIAWSYGVGRDFDKIVANPPYLSIGRLRGTLRMFAADASGPSGARLGSRCNYWAAFLTRSLALLRPGAGLCFILPASWDYANYAAPFRELVPGRFERFDVHRVRESVFDSVCDGCVIIVGLGFGCKSVETRRFEHASASDLLSSLRDGASGRVDQEPRGRNRLVVVPHSVHRLSDVVEIALGGVTGDARYFLLSEGQRVAQRLPVGCLHPVVSRSHHLVAGELTAKQWSGIRDRQTERVWLFRPGRRFLRDKRVKAYLRRKVESGGARRENHKIRTRSPWYCTPLKTRIDGFLSGMTVRGPWIALRRMPRLNATNTLYTVRFRRATTLAERAAWSLSLLTSWTRNQVGVFGRHYADGLLKFEPGDLRAVPVRVPRRTQGAVTAYRAAVRALLAGDETTCRSIADAWLDKGC